MAADGLASRAIARELGCRHHTVSKWRVRFARERLAGLADAPRSGKPKTYGEDAAYPGGARPRPPEGFSRWTAPLIAKALGDVSDQHIWRLLRAQGIDLAGRRSWRRFCSRAGASRGWSWSPRTGGWSKPQERYERAPAGQSCAFLTIFL